jgi:sugar lactone lactonase YvrE
MKVVLFLALLLLSASVATKSERIKPIEFPGTVHSVASPDGKAVISNEDRDQEPNHVLYLSVSGSPSKILILAYSRHVDVLWSPDSRSFFVNDYAQSNAADCILISRGTIKRRSVTRVLTTGRRAPLRGNDDTHLYVTCDEWRGAHTVVVSARGYDGAKSGTIERTFMYDTDSGHIKSAR